MATIFAVFHELAVLGCRKIATKVSLYTRVSCNGKSRYKPVNKKRIYPDGTTFVLRYARQWETLTADNLNAAVR